MDIIYWLIPLTIILLVIAVLIFFWAVKNGQFNDLDSPAVNILLDDDTPKPIQPDHLKSELLKSDPVRSRSIQSQPNLEKKNEQKN